MTSPESLQPSSAFEKKSQNNLHTDFQARFENLTSTFESRILGLERHNLPREEPTKETPANAEFSADRPRETVTVLERNQEAVPKARREERASVQGAGKPSPQELKEEPWFKAGLACKIVRMGYVVSISGSLVTTGFLLAGRATGELITAINAPLVSLFLVTLMYHYKLGKKLPF